MEKSYMIFECKSENEYAQTLALLAMYQVKPYDIVDDLQKLTSCGKGRPEDCLCKKKGRKKFNFGDEQDCGGSGASRTSLSSSHAGPSSSSTSDEDNTSERSTQSPHFYDLSKCMVPAREPTPGHHAPVSTHPSSFVKEEVVTPPSSPSISSNSRMGMRESDVRSSTTRVSRRYPTRKTHTITSIMDEDDNEDSSDSDDSHSNRRKPARFSIEAHLSDLQCARRKPRNIHTSQKKFHEFLLQLLMDSRYEHLIHFSGNSDYRVLQFTIPDRKKFAKVWGNERGQPDYSSTSLVNKDLWNASKAGIFSRILFRDPMLIYRIEPSAEGRFSRILAEMNKSMADVRQYAKNRLELRKKGKI